MEPIKDSAFIDASGKLTLVHAATFAAAIACFPNTPGTVTFEPEKRGISHQQRKYFFGVVCEVLVAFFESTGVRCTKQDVLIFLKDRFLFKEVLSPIDGRFMKVPISLSAGEKALTKEEFNKCYEAIVEWAATKLELHIPSPDPNYKMFRENKKSAADESTTP